jgi:hypothetical protein
MKIYTKRTSLNEKYFSRFNFYSDDGKEKTFTFTKKFLHIEEIVDKRVIGHIEIIIEVDQFSATLYQYFQVENEPTCYDDYFRPVYYNIYDALDHAIFQSGISWKVNTTTH